ncbi:MAG: tetratricopeptide repeat protein [Anaerolineae bacterium]|nr:tetratricopeptide repeat protein [Anaerolineae bacterium]
MAGNSLRFEEAMQKANDFGWAEEWDAAVKLYQRALSEFPDSDSALIGYAWALLNNEQLDEALEVYEHLTKVIPTDPGPYERSAEILEQRGQDKSAANAYIEAAHRYAKQGLGARQMTALESTVRLRPQDKDAWNTLLQLYRVQDERQKAVHAAIWLSYLLQDEDRDRAIGLCREVQAFAPQDPRMGQMVILLQSNRRIPKPPPIGSEEEIVIDSDLDAVDAQQDGGTPVEMARQRALTKLAESIFAEDRTTRRGPSEMAVDVLISRAVDAQTRGDVEVAIQHYEELLDTGLSMSSIHFNLGLLYKEQMRFDEAIAHFEASKSDPEYVLGSHFSLGECYQAQGEFQEALGHFLEAVKVVDIATIEREHVDDLIRVYEGLAQNLVNTGEPQRAEQVSEMLVEFLGRRGWEDSAVKARKRLDDLARMGTVLSLAELISLPGSEDILRSIARVQEYQRRNRIYLALEEIFQALSVTPDYLPLHHLLGILLRDNGHLEEATQKFLTVAETYEIRGQFPQALATYELILDISPLNIPVHRRVVEVLTQHGRIDDALLQYLQMADAYYQLAQPEQARDAYTEALRLAPRGTADRGWQTRILHRMADLDVQRLDWLAAIEDNEDILRISPDDERAHLALYRLYPRTNRPHLGIAALDKLIKRYLSNHKVTKALTILEDLVASDPESIPLRVRIAQLYLNLGRRDEALHHLDVLGDLQLEAGYRDAAIKTIEAMLALNPANREAYADLYREMAGREPPEP